MSFDLQFNDEQRNLIDSCLEKTIHEMQLVNSSVFNEDVKLDCRKLAGLEKELDDCLDWLAHHEGGVDDSPYEIAGKFIAKYS